MRSPDCLFLAGFDPLMLGYEKKQNIFLPQTYLRGIFSLSGIVMPPVLLHGAVTGRWKRSGKRLQITDVSSIYAGRTAHASIAGRGTQLWAGSSEARLSGGITPPFSNRKNHAILFLSLIR